ncbi:Helicase associated domain protein [Streptomyces sp. NPDC002559]
MELRPYQAEAVGAITAGLADGGRGQLHAACGSGKTVMSMRAADQLVAGGGLLVVLAPYLPLVAQTLDAWRSQGRVDAVLAVCSDDTVADAPIRLEDIHAQTTTDPDVIARWLREQGGRRLVVSTYASADRLSAALHATGIRPGLMLLDEAHHLTGPPESPFRRAVDPVFLPARRRLFMTATPRTDAAAAMNHGHLSMDDTGVFGPVLYHYPSGRGIAEGYLSDYRLHVVGVRESEARALLTDPRHEYVEGPGAPSMQTLVAQAALIRAVQHHGVTRALTFHHKVADAAEFARTLPAAARRLAPDLPAPHAAHVHGQMSHDLRDKILDNLRTPPPGTWAAVSNARCLGEGIDVPAIDAVLFAHPKKSGVDIIQAVGRALRPHPDTPGDSVVIVPIVVPEQDGEIGDLDAGAYTTLWQIVRALRAHDEPLGISLDTTRAHLALGTEPRLPAKITVDLPAGTADRVLDQVRLLMVRQVTSPWWEGYGHATAYHDHHGHLDVPSRHVTDSGHRLGQWIRNARQHRRKGWMPADRITALDRIGMIWDTGRHRFDTLLARARAYRERHGHLNVPQAHRDEDGYRLGTQINVLRTARTKDRLSPERIAALDELGMVWDTRDQANQRLIQAARTFHAAHGHLRVPRDHTTHDGYRLGNALATRRNRYAHGDVHVDVVRALDELGMIWDRREARFQDGLAACRRYRDRHGDLDVPTTFTDPEGYNLGDFIAYQRALNTGSIRDKNGRTRTLPPERRTALDELGMTWNAAPARRPPTDEEVTALLALPKQRGKPPATALLALVEAGVEQKALATALNMTPSALNSRIAKARNPTPARPDAFTQGLDQARAHHQLHGHLRPEAGTDPAARSLSDWLTRQRRARRGGKLTPGQIAALDELGMQWDPADARWQQSFQAARAYHTAHGHLRPEAGTVQDGIDLPVWLSRQRAAHRNHTLPPERFAALDELGIDWTPGRGIADVRAERAWYDRLDDARSYHAAHGHLRPPRNTLVNGRRLDAWLSVQRTRHKNGELTPEQTAALEALHEGRPEAAVQAEEARALAAQLRAEIEGAV